MAAFATITDVELLFRPLTSEEIPKATELLNIISDQLRMYAKQVGKDLDEMVEGGEVLPSVVKSVVVDVLGRFLQTPNDEAPMSQFSQSALGYTVSGTYLVAGGGVWVKKSELARLGLRRQKLGAAELYD